MRCRESTLGLLFACLRQPTVCVGLLFASAYCLRRPTVLLCKGVYGSSTAVCTDVSDGYMQPSSLDGSNTTCDGHLVFVVGIDVVGIVQQRREAQWHDCTECSMEHSIEHLIEHSIEHSIGPAISSAKYSTEPQTTDVVHGSPAPPYPETKVHCRGPQCRPVLATFFGLLVIYGSPVPPRRRKP